MWQTINTWDTWLFLEINRVWTNGFLDSLFPWYRDETTWIPLYFFLVVFTVANFGWKKALPWIIAVVVCLTLSDQISSKLIKAFFHRPRPCRDPVIAQYGRLLLNYCPGNASFTSSHAANHFATCTFFFLTLKPFLKRYAYLFLFIAASVSYGQVYVGVHYPLDVLGGALVGYAIGRFIAAVYRRQFGGLQPATGISFIPE
jgi:membrane-associated phospholipid phosphatase